MSLLVAIAIFVGASLVTKSEPLARRLGRWAGRVAAFLVAFPLTLFPLQGLGILDATIVAELTAVGGVELEAGLVAAVVTYRVVTLGTPALLGALFISGWRYTSRRAGAPD